MLNFKYKEKSYSIEWKYETFSKVKTKTKQNVETTIIEYYKITTCIIQQENPIITISGSAICNPTDNFNKETGRVLSLEKAISLLDKDFQIECLKQYNKRKND